MAPRIRAPVILACTLLLLTVPLTGCLGQDGLQPADSSDASSGNASGQDPDVTDPTDPSSTENDTSDASEATNGTLPADANPWQRGLATRMQTPAIAVQEPREERRGNVAPPGDPEFAAFDAAIQAWMTEQGIPAAGFALAHEGELRYEAGYGHTNRDRTEPANASTLFRIMSITKPITAAIVDMQVEQGLYNGSDPVFCVGSDPAPNCRLPIDPHPSKPVADDRLGNVTVLDLVEHRGGFALSGEYFWGDKPFDVAEAFDTETPPPAWRLAQDLMGEEMATEPGTTYDYCNVCYMLLELVAEAATGTTFEAQLDAYIVRPLELEGDLRPGKGLPEDRPPRETFYHCAFERRSVYDPNETVCAPDGGFDMDAMLGLGGLIATPAAVEAVYDAYPEHMVTYLDRGPAHHGGHTGGSPGTATFTGTLEDDDTAIGEVQYAVFFNRQGPYDARWTAGVRSYNFEDVLLPLITAWAAEENQGMGTDGGSLGAAGPGDR